MTDKMEEEEVDAAPNELLPEAYHVVRVLGHGAFGEAVLYRKVEDNTLVVWKEVNLCKASERERNDALKEIDILSLLNHPNIVTYFNHYFDNTSLFIEMEYCNGGTLHDKICAQQTTLFSEEVVVWFFFQIASAVAHIHENGILHRDIKSLNIFLTKSGLVKLGDFGISKILDSTCGMAESLVGTPYYMSPELCRGEKYGQKSDIWAVGCVLYEMLTLRKVFDASNPLKLVSDIVKGEYEKVDEQEYTEEMRDLVDKLLVQNPEDRPMIQEILDYPLFSLLKGEMERKVWELNSSTRKARLASASADPTVPVVTSKVSEVYFWGGGKQTPQRVEVFNQGNIVLQVAAGHSHFAVVTIEKEVYTWANAQGGAPMVGQLGHGDTASYRMPKRIDALQGIAVKRVSCGEEFTACLTEHGALYMFGSDYYGCMGCDCELGDSALKPTMVQFFVGKMVEDVACGDAHVVALTTDKEVYSWGCGEYGRLGLGDEEDYSLPQKLNLPTRCKVSSISCGAEGTFLLTTTGRVMAFGNNDENQLGLNQTPGLRKRQIKSGVVHSVNVPTPVQSLNRYNIVKVSAGKSHSAVIDSFNRLIMVGCNKFGQLGLGDYKQHQGPNVVTGDLVGKQVVQVACGDGYTVIATSDNMIYSWGKGDNGRLGLDTLSLSRQKGGVVMVSSPRPIFGALHVVSSLSSRHWNSILVVEKVLNSRTLKPNSSQSGKLDSLGGSGGGESSDDAGRNIEVYDGLSLSRDSGNPWSPRSDIAESNGSSWRRKDSDELFARSIESRSPDLASSAGSSIPAWLKNELEDAEYIPIDTSHRLRHSQSDTDVRRSNIFSPSSSSSTASQYGDHEDGFASILMWDEELNMYQYKDLHEKENNQEDSDMITKLTAQVQQLQTEKEKLQKSVMEQQIQIRSLEKENEAYIESYQKFWHLVDAWNNECQSVIGVHQSINDQVHGNHVTKKSVLTPILRKKAKDWKTQSSDSALSKSLPELDIQQMHQETTETKASPARSVTFSKLSVSKSQDALGSEDTNVVKTKNNGKHGHKHKRHGLLGWFQGNDKD